MYCRYFLYQIRLLVFQSQYITPACIKTMMTNFSKKDFFETLCLKISIPKIAPIVPPIKVAPKSVLSGILLLCLMESLLSQPKIMKVIKLIINRMYIIIIGQK